MTDDEDGFTLFCTGPGRAGLGCDSFVYGRFRLDVLAEARQDGWLTYPVREALCRACRHRHRRSL